jgi:hypothetical protein
MEGWPTGEIFMLCPRRNVLYKHILKKNGFEDSILALSGFRRQSIFALFFLLLVLPDTASAVNFYDGARAKQGTYFLTYTSVYAADKTTNGKGNHASKDMGLLNAQELLRLCYYSPDFVATALVPFGLMKIDSLDQESSGIGDINLGAGYFLPIRNVDILPMIFVEYPTGQYSSAKSANIGSNQLDIKPVVFLHKSMGDFSIDAAVKYVFRFETERTDVLPGDEFHLQCLLGYHLTEKFKLGPSVNWLQSKEKKQNGTAVDDSARAVLSVGADIYYRFSRFGITLTYLCDVYTENSAQGHFVQIKTVYRF